MSGTISSAVGQASNLLPSGYLSTSGSQIVDASGNDVRIASVGWNENFGNIPASVAQMAADGFNTIRISWVDATLSSDLARIEQVVAAATAVGMKVILDHHTDEAGTPADGWGSQQSNGLWFDSGPGTDGTNGAGITGTVSAAQFQADWTHVAQTFAGNSTVIGFDIDNEPTSVGNINWGQGGPTDIHAMYTSVGNAIQAVDPGALIIAEGPQEYNAPSASSGMNGSAIAPEGDLSGAGAVPVVLNTPNKVVYSVHEYPSTISGTALDSGPAFVQQLNSAWGYLVTNNIAPVWIGEMGASLDGTAESAGAGLANEQAWASTLLGYVNGQDGTAGGPTFSGTQQAVSADWWNWGYNPGQYPDGTLNADGTLNQAQVPFWSQILPKRFPATAAPAPIPTPAPAPATAPTPKAPPSVNDTIVKAGSTAAITDSSGNQWAITSGAQVAINGTTDTTTANVTELAYVNGTIWQENASKLWWGETKPNAAWSPSAGTSTSPLPVAPPPSANDTVVKAGASAAISDSSGNQWTITSGGQVAINGTADTTTANVTELAYVNGTIWQENASKLWWGEMQPNAAWSPSAGTSTSPLPVALSPSANYTVVMAGAAAAIIDASGNKWTITTGGQVAVNGAADPTTANVTELAYVYGTIWQESASKLWWGETKPNAAWSPSAGTSTDPLPVSANDTAVMAAAHGMIVDADGNQWTITSGGQVAVNGTADTTTAKVTELAYVNGTIWQENTSKLWWGETKPNAAWSPSAGTSTSPLPPLITIGQAQTSAAVSQNDVLVTATVGDHMVMISGNGDIVNVSGGTNTITDTGSKNIYVVPAAGKGLDAFTSNIFAGTDMLDLRPALAATNWDGTTATLSNFVIVTNSALGAVVSIASISGATPVRAASIAGASTANLTTLLSHALT